jgi:hypothetical protein
MAEKEDQGMTATSPPLTVTPAAQRFIHERRAQDSLDILVNLTAQVFADAGELSVELHEDPDFADVKGVLIRVEVPWEDGERARQARDEWYARTAEVCSPAVLADFGLEIDRRPPIRV